MCSRGLGSLLREEEDKVPREHSASILPSFCCVVSWPPKGRGGRAVLSRPRLGWDGTVRQWLSPPMASRSRELEEPGAEQGLQLCPGAWVSSRGLVWATSSASRLLLPHPRVLRVRRVAMGAWAP